MQRTSFVAALLVVLGMVPGSVAAQSPRAPTRVPVTLVLAQGRPAGEPYVIHRGMHGMIGDIILLRGDATPTDLSDAVRALLQVRALDGDTAATPRMLRLRPRQPPAAARPDLPWAARVMDDLRAAPPTPIPGVGRHPAVEIWLPPTRRAHSRALPATPAAASGPRR